MKRDASSEQKKQIIDNDVLDVAGRAEAYK